MSKFIQRFIPQTSSIPIELGIPQTSSIPIELGISQLG
jgi:hypothetical protein